MNKENEKSKEQNVGDFDSKTSYTGSSFSHPKNKTFSIDMERMKTLDPIIT